MRFSNRDDAARQLAHRLYAYKGARPLVLGLPRGAVPMARVIADALDGDLDVVLVRKLRAAGQPELAIGAVDEQGRVLHGAYFDRMPEAYVREEIREQQALLRSRRARYTQTRPARDPAGRVVILVDDGVATGASMLAAVRSVRASGPSRIVVAVGVAPPETLDRLRADADEVVCLYAPASFGAVGEFFDDFSEVTDDMVLAALGARSTAGSGGNLPGPVPL